MKLLRLFAPLLLFTLVTLVTLALALAPRSNAQAPAVLDLVEPFGMGRINWTRGYVEATGSGAPNPDAPSMAVARLGAERAARMDALRNLLETTQGVRITGETTVRNFVLESQSIRARVEGIVKGATEVDRRYLSDGGVSVTMRILLWGTFARTIVESLGRGSPGEPQDRGDPLKPEHGRLLEHPLLERFAALFLPRRAFAQPAGSEELQKELVATGLILDLTGTEAKPELLPRIVDEESGTVLIDARAASVERAAAGMIGYASSVEAALEQTDRVGNTPYIAKALNAVSGASEGLKVRLAGTWGEAISDPVETLKKGVVVAYQFGI